MSRRLAGALVFGTSATVLVVEIVAGRLLAPYFGVSLDTFTAIIGVVLAGIAAGSWWGGRVADRVDPHGLLVPQLLVGGIATLAVVPIVRALGPALAPAGIPGLILLTSAAALLPAAALSAITPTVVKIVLADLDRTGRVVGRLSALGTLGALAGTFGAGYALIGNLPTSVIMTGAGLVPVAAGAGLWATGPRTPRAPTVAGALVAAVVLAVPAVALAGPCEVETRFTCATIVIPPDDPSARVLILDSFTNSHVQLDDPTVLAFSYTRMFAAVTAAGLPPGPLDAVHIGGGGYTMPRWLEATRPGSASTVLELDPALETLARSRLGLEPSEGITTITGDARTSLRSVPAGSVDLVLGDAFSGLTVPWHLTTVEFVTDIVAILRPGGIYQVNVIDRGELGFLRAQAATLAVVFPEVAIVTLPERLETGGNFVVVGSEAPLDAGTVQAAAAVLGLDVAVIQGDRLEALIDGARPLIDDFAPVDQLLGAVG
jgi:spermidine synthase